MRIRRKQCASSPLQRRSNRGEFRIDTREKPAFMQRHPAIVAKRRRVRPEDRRDFDTVAPCPRDRRRAGLNATLILQRPESIPAPPPRRTCGDLPRVTRRVHSCRSVPLRYRSRRPWWYLSRLSVRSPGCRKFDHSQSSSAVEDREVTIHERQTEDCPTILLDR